MFFTNSELSPEEVLAEFRKLKAIRPDWLDWFGTPKHQRHARQYDKVKRMALTNQQALYDLIFSKLPTEEELHTLIYLGSHGGSVAKEDNRRWHNFVAKVRERQNELPETVQMSLDWLLRIQGW